MTPYCDRVVTCHVKIARDRVRGNLSQEKPLVTHLKLVRTKPALIFTLVRPKHD